MSESLEARRRAIAAALRAVAHEARLEELTARVDALEAARPSEPEPPLEDELDAAMVDHDELASPAPPAVPPVPLTGRQMSAAAAAALFGD